MSAVGTEEPANSGAAPEGVASSSTAAQPGYSDLPINYNGYTAKVKRFDQNGGACKHKGKLLTVCAI